MRSRIDLNQALISGKVARAKAWPSKGKPFSSGSVSLLVEKQTVDVKIFLETTQKRDETKAFEELFRPGRWVALSNGVFTSWQKKDDAGNPIGPEKFQLDAKILGAYPVQENTPFCQATVSGTISSVKDEWAVLEAFYLSGGKDDKKRELKARRIRVLRPAGRVEEKGHIVALGTIEVNEKGPYVKATSIVQAE